MLFVGGRGGSISPKRDQRTHEVTHVRSFSNSLFHHRHIDGIRQPIGSLSTLR